MTADFILSLDCEGKWGMADRLGGVHDSITQGALDDAYAFLFDALAANRIKATLAFTSLFTVDERVIQDYGPHLAEFSDRVDSWYGPISQMIANQDFDGWLGNAYFRRARSEGHELAWHGFTHHQLSDDVPESIVAFELESGLDVAIEHEVSLKSLVFPRNATGHLDLFECGGFACYRAAPETDNRLLGNRYVRVLDEFNVFKHAQPSPARAHDCGIACLPSGYFLNWPSGVRGWVPSAVTNQRWKHILNDAVRHGGQVHVWFHPHNLITAPRMRKNFLAILAYASSLITEGRLINHTMIESLESTRKRT